MLFYRRLPVVRHRQRVLLCISVHKAFLWNKCGILISYPLIHTAMSQKTIVLTVILFALIVVGMFVFATLRNAELQALLQDFRNYL